MQVDARRLFVHEHPNASSSRQVPHIEKLIARPDTMEVKMHMWCFNLKTCDEHGEGFALKRTRVFRRNRCSVSLRRESQKGKVTNDSSSSFVQVEQVVETSLGESNKREKRAENDGNVK